MQCFFPQWQGHRVEDCPSRSSCKQSNSVPIALVTVRYLVVNLISCCWWAELIPCWWHFGWRKYIILFCHLFACYQQSPFDCTQVGVFILWPSILNVYLTTQALTLTMTWMSLNLDASVFIWIREVMDLTKPRCNDKNRGPDAIFLLRRKHVFSSSQTQEHKPLFLQRVKNTGL